MVRRRKHGDQVRIIGGNWRGRRLHFHGVDNVRPTPDRVRETVFNWLQTLIAGARCLDLFAGSGALGIEALSRGAAEVVFVERHTLAAHLLQENLSLLRAASNQVVQADVLVWLRTQARPFDIVFLDPPFGQGLVVPVCEALEQGGWLMPRTYIYLESEAELDHPRLPATWGIIRDKRAGQVRYRLALRSV